MTDIGTTLRAAEWKGLGLPNPWSSNITWTVLALGAIGGIVNSAIRRPTVTA